MWQSIIKISVGLDILNTRQTTFDLFELKQFPASERQIYESLIELMQSVWVQQSFGASLLPYLSNVSHIRPITIFRNSVHGWNPTVNL